MGSTISVIEELEYTALRVTFPRDLQCCDLEDVSDWMAGYLNRADAPVHVIVDVRASPLLPVIKTAHYVSRVQHHPNIGGAFVVGKSSLARLVEQMVETFTGKQSTAVWCHSLEEAYTHLVGCMPAVT